MIIEYVYMYQDAGKNFVIKNIFRVLRSFFFICIHNLSNLDIW